MKNTTNRWRVLGTRSRGALCLLALVAALLVTAVIFRPAQSQQARPDPAADALPRLNVLGRHKAEAADFATQIKARYEPTSAEYAEARRRYEAAAEVFDALVDTLATSVKDDSGGHAKAALREQTRLAVEAGDSFSDWADDTLQLLRRERRPGAALRKGAKADEAAEAAEGLANAFGPKEEPAKGRAVVLMGELVKFRPWDEVPPVTPPGGGAAAPTPSPSPSPTPPAGR